MFQRSHQSIRMMNLLIFLVAWFVGAAAAAQAQNLVQNAEFDFDVSSWTASGIVEIEHRADVGSTLDGASGPGALEVRFFNWNGGVYGQGLPAVGPGVLNRVVIPGLFKNPSQRTNVGVLNTSAQTLDVDVDIWDDEGVKIAEAFWTLLPYSHRQSSLNSIGAGSMSGGTVIITRRSSGGSFRAYTSTVDQKSGDAVYNPGQ